MADVLRIKRRALGGAAGAPGSLAVGELAFNEQDGGLYIGRSNGSIVQVNSAGGGPAIVSMSDTPPASPTDAQLWLETDTGLLFARWNDGTSTQWVCVGGGASTSGADVRLDAYDAMHVTRFDTIRVGLAGMFTFSENDLRVTKATNEGAWNAVLSQPSTTEWDLLYFEATPMVGSGGQGPMIGVASRAFGTGGNYPGANTVSSGFVGNGNCYYNASAGGGYPTYTTNDTLAFAVRITDGYLWMRNVTTNSLWNNIAGTDPAGSPPNNPAFGGGMSFISGGSALAVCIGLFSVTHSVRLNFDGPFLGTVPTGYRRWRGRAAA